MINLNVTSKDINVAKAGPIKSFLNRATGDAGLRIINLDDHAKKSTSSTMRQMICDGRWAHIKKAMVEVYEDIDEKLSQHEVTTPFQDNLHKLIQNMDIE